MYSFEINTLISRQFLDNLTLSQILGNYRKFDLFQNWFLYNLTDNKKQFEPHQKIFETRNNFDFMSKTEAEVLMMGICLFFTKLASNGKTARL